MAFQTRLRTAMRDGNLTVADLARWFRVPYPTVRTWVVDGCQPSGGPIDRMTVEHDMRRLEIMIKRRRGFPLQRGAGRIGVLMRARDDAQYLKIKDSP